MCYIVAARPIVLYCRTNLEDSDFPKSEEPKNEISMCSSFVILKENPEAIAQASKEDVRYEVSID